MFSTNDVLSIAKTANDFISQVIIMNNLVNQTQQKSEEVIESVSGVIECDGQNQLSLQELTHKVEIASQDIQRAQSSLLLEVRESAQQTNNAITELNQLLVSNAKQAMFLAFSVVATCNPVVGALSAGSACVIYSAISHYVNSQSASIQGAVDQAQQAVDRSVIITQRLKADLQQQTRDTRIQYLQCAGVAVALACLARMNPDHLPELLMAGLTAVGLTAAGVSLSNYCTFGNRSVVENSAPEEDFVLIDHHEVDNNRMQGDFEMVTRI